MDEGTTRDTGTDPADDTGTDPADDTGTDPANDTGTDPANETGSESAVAWRSWDQSVFDAARDADRPVLCSLVAPWCVECHVDAAAAFADPDVAAAIDESFVPVRVDADRRPRVRERYTVGGFPSTLALTPTGRILDATTATTADELRAFLERAHERWAAGSDDGGTGATAGKVPRALRSGDPPAGDPVNVPGAVADAIETHYDAAYSGWGTDAKFPLPDAVAFALKRDRRRALGTLDAVLGGLQDDDGGFFRYAATREWGDPHRAKLLDENAALLRALAHAYCYTGGDRYREAAVGVRDYLAETLWTGSGFGGSQAPPALDGGRIDGGLADETVFADRNAVAADALCHLTAYTDDDRAREYAERTLEHLASSLVDGGTVAHYEDAPASERGTLADGAAVARAFATAASVFGPDRGPEAGYLATARTVADETLDALRDGDSCTDGPATGGGLLDRPLRPVGANGLLADALVDLAELAGGEDAAAYRETAVELVRAFAGGHAQFGPGVAGYARAADRATTRPLRVLVGAPAGSDLHRAAVRIADHEKVVVPGAAEPDAGSAVVRGPGGEVTAETPDGLVGGVGEVL